MLGTFSSRLSFTNTKLLLLFLGWPLHFLNVIFGKQSADLSNLMSWCLLHCTTRILDWLLKNYAVLGSFSTIVMGCPGIAVQDCLISTYLHNYWIHSHDYSLLLSCWCFSFCLQLLLPLQLLLLVLPLLLLLLLHITRIYISCVLYWIFPEYFH